MAISLGTLLVTVTYPPQRLTINGGLVLTASGETLNVTVKGGGLASSDHVQVQVQASGATTRSANWTYQATIGADPNGTVDDPINLTLPHGTYRDVKVFAWIGEAAGKLDKCSDLGQRATCVDFVINPGPPFPQLVASW